MNRNKALDYIYNMELTSKMSDLDRMKRFMTFLGNPQDKLKCVHIAGTNGKGSACAMISSILNEAGYNVGMFTSPHLIDPEERFVINGKKINSKDLSYITLKLKKAIETLNEKPTIFEKLTILGFIYFEYKKVDVLVLEVGLGGRLDATNIIKDPLVSLIMNIGLDHTEILGKTLPKIAYEKAGIIKEKSDVVVYDNSKAIINVFEKVVNEKHAKLHKSDFKEIEIIDEGLISQKFNYKKYKNVELSLLGKHQFKNAAVVLESIDVLKKKGFKISKDDIYGGLKNTDWLARLSVLNKEPLFIMDGAHNLQCAKALKDSLPKLLQNKKAYMICGMLKDKDYNAVMDLLLPYSKEVCCLTPDSHRALSGNQLKKVIDEKGYKAKSFKDAYKALRYTFKKAKKDDVIIAFGSLYLAGEIVLSFNRLKKEI